MEEESVCSVDVMLVIFVNFCAVFCLSQCLKINLSLCLIIYRFMKVLLACILGHQDVDTRRLLFSRELIQNNR